MSLTKNLIVYVVCISVFVFWFEGDIMTVLLSPVLSEVRYYSWVLFTLVCNISM